MRSKVFVSALSLARCGLGVHDTAYHHRRQVCSHTATAEVMEHALSTERKVRESTTISPQDTQHLVSAICGRRTARAARVWAHAESSRIGSLQRAFWRSMAVYPFLEDLKDAEYVDPDSGLCLKDPGLDWEAFIPTRREKYRMALVGERERLQYLDESAMMVVVLCWELSLAHLIWYNRIQKVSTTVEGRTLSALGATVEGRTLSALGA
eukprot:3941176-Rhodomonas_salina.4